MLDKLFSLFGNNVFHMSSAIGVVVSLIDLFDQKFGEDKNAKNAAIDCMIELLQKHKTP